MRRLLFGALLLGACKPGPKVPSDTLIVAIESEVRNLDLRQSADQNAAHLTTLMTQKLVEADERLEPVASLALSVEEIGAKLFRFRLPKDVTFHDGTPLGCADVLYNFEDAANSPKSRVRSTFVDVKNFRCEAEDLFVIELKAPRPDFLKQSVLGINIFPRHLMDKEGFSAKPVASGPYRFVERSGRDLIFERYDGVRRRQGGQDLPPPRFRRIIVRTIEDPVTRYLSLVGGDVEAVFNGLSAKKVREAQGEQRLQVLRGPGSSYNYIGINHRHPQLRDRRVREALAYAIDRQTIIESKLLGAAQLATNLLTPLSPNSNPGVKPWPYDPAKARALLKEAKAEGVELEFKTSADRDVVSTALALKDQLEAVGFRIRLRSMEFPTFFADVQAGRFDLFLLRWTASVDSDLLYKVFHSSQTPPGRNRGFYRNAAVDAVLEKAYVELDKDRRRQLFWRAQELVRDDLPYVSLWYPDNVVVAAKTLKNFRLHPTGSWRPLFDAYKEETP